MTETVLQYYFRPSILGGHALWVRKLVVDRRYDCRLGLYRDFKSTVDRKATPSEAAALLPVINAGLPAAS